MAMKSIQYLRLLRGLKLSAFSSSYDTFSPRIRLRESVQKERGCSAEKQTTKTGALGCTIGKRFVLFFQSIFVVFKHEKKRDNKIYFWLDMVMKMHVFVYMFQISAGVQVFLSNNMHITRFYFAPLSLQDRVVRWSYTLNTVYLSKFQIKMQT